MINIYIILVVCGLFWVFYLDFCGLAWYLLTFTMGLDPGKQWKGVWLTFFDIKQGPYSLPAPPNGTWYCPWIGPFAFGLTGDVWSMHFAILDYAPYVGCSEFAAKLITPDTWVFYGLTYPGGPDDLYRGENEITDPLEAYYGGYATIIPIFDTDMPSDIASIVEALKFAGPGKVFAEGMGAAVEKRAIRLARPFDHSCCHFVLPPITNVL